MLSFSSPLASLSYRHISLGVTKGITPGLRLLSTSRVRSHRPKAFFGGNQGDSDQHLDDFLASSWGGEQPDWTESPYQPDVLDEVWYEEDASPEALAQNALAVALSALLLWGCGSILWKLAVVSYALFAAAFRYSFVALVLLVVVVFLAA